MASVRHVDVVTERKRIYLGTAVVLFLSYFLLRDSAWRGNMELHTLMETIATVLALNVGILALVRFYSKKDNTFLFVGTGFFATGLLDGYHAIVTSSFFAANFPSPSPSLIPWSWLASRLFLSVLLWLSWLFWKREAKLGQAGRVSERWVYAIVGSLALMCFVFFAFVTLPQAYYPKLFFQRPQELLPASFFLLALVGYLRKGRWKDDAFEHWLVLSIIVGFMGQVMFMSFSGKLYDGMFDIAHLLKKLSYICALIGLLISMYQLFLSAITDLNERMLAEEEIGKQQKLTSQIIETIPLRVFWKDKDSHYLGCNSLFAKDAGLARPSELIGKSDFDMGWREQAELYRADDRLVMDTNTSKPSYDEPQTTPDGGRIWLRTSKVPLRNEANVVFGILGIYEDITTYKQMELRLLESEERFRNAFQNSAIGMALVGLEGRWLKVNDALCRIVGYSEQELLGKPFQDIVHPDDLQIDSDMVTQLLAGEIDHYQTEKRNFHKDRHTVWVRLSVSLVRDVQDNPVHFIFQIEDITLQRSAEENIRKLNEDLEIKVQERTMQLLAAQEELVRKEKLALLGQVADNVGHELRNPLGVMNNAVYFLQTVLADADDTTKEYLGIIKDEIADAERIVSDLLDAVRTKSPHPAVVNVAEAIGQTLRKCTVPSSISVQLEFPETLPPVRFDPMHLHQVFWNLITNAAEAMPEGGTLAIRAEEVQHGIRIGVEDSGIGMTSEQQARLFQPMFTTKARRVGLGLMVVKNLTQLNGGSVEVESAPNKGSVFTVMLPRGT